MVQAPDFRRFRARLIASTALVAVGVAWPAMAQVKNGSVAAGAATITQSGAQTEIKQTSDRAILNWQSFSIPSGSAVRFQQPSGSSVTLNRVTGGDVSTIQGQLSANGQVLLINPNGVLIDRGARIDVGGLTATSAAIADQDFMAGRMTFTDPGKPGAIVENRGSITAAEGGYVVLAGRAVSNSGVIDAKLGTVVLAGAKRFVLDIRGDRLLAFDITEAVDGTPTDREGKPVAALVDQSGVVRADGGKVVLTARGAENVIAQAVNNKGLLRAQSVSIVNGEVILDGGPGGSVSHSGAIDVTGSGDGAKGGAATVLGGSVTLDGAASIDASGSAGGGSILVGGDYQGRPGVPTSSTVTVGPAATLRADALDKGDGGKIIAWSEQGTRFSGTASVKGGPNGGDGGLVETSSRGRLAYDGRVDLKAPRGRAGTLVLDPDDLAITATTDNNVDLASQTITTTGAGSVLTVASISAALDSGNVVIQTAGTVGGSGGTITLSASLAKTTANSLTLKAHRSIALTSAGTISFAGAGAVALIADQLSSGTGAITGASGSQIVVAGDLSLKAGNGIGTSANPIAIQVGGALAARSGTGGVFVQRIAGAGSLTVGSSGGLVGVTTTGAGTISLQGTNADVIVGQAVTAASGPVSISAGTGSLTISGGVTVGASAGVTLTADQINITGSIAGGTGAVTLQAATGTFGVQLGTAAKPASTLAFSEAELNRISSSSGIVVGDSGGGDISVQSAMTLLNGTGGLTASKGGSLSFVAGATVTGPRISLSGLSGAAITENVTGSGGVTLSGGTGGLTISSGVTVGNAGGSGAVTLIGDTLSIPAGASVVGGTGAVTLRPASNGRAMDLTALTKPGTAFELSSAEIDRATTSGSVTLGFSGAGATTVSQAYTRSGVTSFAIVSGGLVTLPNALTVTGGTLSVTGVGVTVNAVQTGAAVTVNSGTGTLTNNSTITNGAGAGVVTLIGDSIDLATGSAVTAGSGVVTLRQSTNVRPINIGPTTNISGAVEISDAEFGRISTTGKVVVGDTNAGTVTFSNAVSANFSTTPLQVVSGRQVVGSGYAGTNLAIQAGTGVSVTTSAATVAASTSSGTISLTLTGANPTIGTVAGVSGITSANGAIQIDAGANLLTFGGSISNGGGANSAAITVIGDRIAIAAGGIAGGAGLVTLKPSTGGRTIDLGSTTDAGVGLELSGAELGLINTSGTLAIGSTSGAQIATSQNVATTTVATLALLSGADVSISHNLTVTGQLRTQSTGLTLLATKTASGSTGVFLDSGTAMASLNGTVSNTGGGSTAPITVAADRLDLTSTGAIVGGAGIVTLRTSTNGRPIDLGSTTDVGAATEISVAEANRVTTSGRLVIGSAGSAISVTTPFAVGASAPTVMLTGTTIDTAVGGGAFTATNLALSATGAIGASNGGFNATPSNLAAQAGGAATFYTGGADVTVAAIAGLSGVASSGGAVSLSVGAGKLTLTGTIGNGGGASTQAVTVIADRMDLQTGSAIQGGAGAVTLRPSTSGRGISLGPTVDANAALELSSAELNKVATTGALTVGGSSAGPVTFTAPIALGGGLPIVSIVSGGAITGGGAGAALSSSGGVALTAATDVTNLSVSVGTLAAQGAGTISIAGSGANLTVGAVAGLPGVVSTGGGPVTLNAGTGLLANNGTISTSGAQLTLTGDRMDLAAGSVIKAGTGAVVIGPSTAGRGIDLGSTTNVGTGLELSAAELATINTASGVSVSTTGAVAVTQTVTSAKPLTVSATGISVSAAGGITAPAGVTLNAGTGVLTNAGAISNGAGGGTIALTADRIDLAAGGSVQAGAGTVQIAAATAGRAIDLGSTSDSAAAIELSNAELNRISTTQPIVIGGSTAGAATFTAPITLAGGATQMTVTTGSSITQTGTNTIFTGGGLGLKAAGVIGTSANPMMLSVSNLAAVSTGGSVTIGLTGASTTIGTVGAVAGIGAPVATSTVKISGATVAFANNTPSVGTATVTATGTLTIAGATPGTFAPVVNGTLNAVSPTGTVILIGSGGTTTQLLPSDPTPVVIPPVVTTPTTPTVTPPTVVTVTPPPTIVAPPVAPPPAAPIVVVVAPLTAAAAQALLTSGGLLNGLLLSVAASSPGDDGGSGGGSAISSVLNLTSNDSASSLLSRLLGRTLLETDGRRGQIPGITDYFSTLGNAEQW